MKKRTFLFAIFFVLIVVGFLIKTLFVYAAAVTWTQNDWTGGSGQVTWSDITRFNTFATGNYETSNINLVSGIGPSIDADIVVGQPNMTSNSVYQGGVGAGNNLSFSPDAAVFGNKLFVVDALRVLVFNSIPTANNTTANFVIGRPSLTDVSFQAAAANTTGSPNSITSDGTKLLIADTGNNRVLIFNTIPTTDNASANFVIGQPNMTASDPNQGNPDPTANTLYFPHSVHYDTTVDKLFIADEYNHRILVYNDIPVTDDASADFAIGQRDLVSKVLADPPTNLSLSYPYDVYSDGTRLFVADYGNNRVLIWNTIPIAFDTPADVVVGQPDMVSNLANDIGDPATPTLTGLQGPTCVYSDGTKLYICDTDNSRVLVYDSIPTTDHATADYVIGQISGRLDNRGGSANSNTLSRPYNIYKSGNQLFVADQNNYRILIYDLTTQTSVLTSSTYDAGTSYTWGPLTYTATTPTNTSVSFEVSTDGGSTWVPVTNYTTQVFGPSTTVAYRATLANTDGISTPILQDVTIGGNLAPTVTTAAATLPTRTGVTLNGEITATGGVNATSRGFEYGSSTSYGSTITQSGSYSTGTFTDTLSALLCNTDYHYRAYATNLAGTSYGSDVSFITSACATSSGGGGGGSSSTPPPTIPPVIPPVVVPPVMPPFVPPVVPPTTPPTPPVTPPTTPTTPTVPTVTTPSAGTPPLLPENNIVLSKSTEILFSSVRTFFTSPIARTFGNVALAVPVVISLLALLASFFSGVPFLNQIFYSLVLLSQILGFARKPKPWGTIYDSYTKRPLPYARVEILNEQNRKLQATITDANGRYGFLISERLSNIQLKAYLTKYDFPSREEPSVVEQKLYPNIYRGGFIDITSGLTNFDLPMDPRDKASSHSFYFGISSMKLNNLLVNAANVLFILGATFGTVNAIVNPNTLNFIILALILTTFLLRISGFKLKPFGLTKDQETNQTLPFGFIALHNQGGERVNFTVSDDRGRYFLLTAKGNYLLKAYTPSHISPTRTKEIPISATKGWISREIGV